MSPQFICIKETMRCITRNKLFKHCSRAYKSENRQRRCLVFPGQGAQYVGMARDLHDTFPYIKSLMQEADDMLGHSLSNTMFNGDISELTRTINAQPAVLMHSLSLLKVLRTEYGAFNENDFDIAMGLSLGEYSALCALECIDSGLDAVYLVNERARAMNECCINNKDPTFDQKMLAIIHDGTLTMDALRLLIDSLDVMQSDDNKYVADIANLNGPRQFVVSGHTYALDALQSTLKEKRIASKYINTGGAFHSSLMFDAQIRLKETLKNIQISLPKQRHSLISNVSATVVNCEKYTDSEIIKELLCNQVCSTVSWYPSVLRCIQEFGVSEFVEIGPKTTLSAMVRDICKQNGIQNIKVSNFDKLDDLKQFQQNQ